MTECVTYNGGLTVCYRGPIVELKREPAGIKWCFRCRKHLPHDDVCTADAEPSYYDPDWRYECSRCKGDFTVFPGCEL